MGLHFGELGMIFGVRNGGGICRWHKSPSGGQFYDYLCVEPLQQYTIIVLRLQLFSNFVDPMKLTNIVFSDVSVRYAASALC